MTTNAGTSRTDYGVCRTWYGDDWRVDDEGVLHVGGRGAPVEHIRLDCEVRPAE